ncbi:hypothetical protein GKODMF_14520 [Candidatus Electrothrix gigas]
MNTFKSHKILKYIPHYYILVVLIGGVQFAVSTGLFGPSSNVDSIEFFYMLTRLLLSFYVLIAWKNDNGTQLTWVLITENITNAYFNLYVLGETTYYLAKIIKNHECTKHFIYSAWLTVSFDILLLSISLYILSYIFKNFKAVSRLGMEIEN